MKGDFSSPPSKVWTPPKPSYCSPKPIFVPRDSQQPYFSPSSPVSPHWPSNRSQAAVAARPTTPIRESSKPASNPLQPYYTDSPIYASESLEKLQSWTFNPCSPTTPEPSDCSVSPVVPSCSPKTRLTRLLPTNTHDSHGTTTHDRSVFEDWEEHQERLRNSSPLTPGHASKAWPRASAAHRFFTSPIRQLSRRDSTESAVDPLADDVLASSIRSVDGHGHAARLRLFSSRARKSSISKAAVVSHVSRTPSNGASDLFSDGHSDDHGRVTVTKEQLVDEVSIVPKQIFPINQHVPTQPTIGLGLEVSGVTAEQHSPFVQSAPSRIPKHLPRQTRNRHNKADSSSPDSHERIVSPLRFDPNRRPRAPFPSRSPGKIISPAVQCSPLRPIPSKAATLLGTQPGTMFALPSPPSVLDSPRLPPCPDRMRKYNEIVRPKAAMPLKQPPCPPPRPSRPEPLDVFAEQQTLTPSGMPADEPQSSEQVPVEKIPPPLQRISRPVRRGRRLAKPLPVPKSPIPPVPKTADDTRTPPGWTVEKTTQRMKTASMTQKYYDVGTQADWHPWRPQSPACTYTPFEAKVLRCETDDDITDEDTPTTVVRIDVGGLSFMSDLLTLCPQGVPISKYGFAAWLRKCHARLVRHSDRVAYKLSPARISQRVTRGSKNTVNSYDDDQTTLSSGCASNKREEEEEAEGGCDASSSSSDNDSHKTMNSTASLPSPDVLMNQLDLLSTHLHPTSVMQVRKTIKQASIDDAAQRQVCCQIMHSEAGLTLQVQTDAEAMHKTLSRTPTSVSNDSAWSWHEDSYDQSYGRMVDSGRTNLVPPVLRRSSLRRSKSSMSDERLPSSQAAAAASSVAWPGSHRRSSSTPQTQSTSLRSHRNITSACLTPTEPGDRMAQHGVPTFIFSPTPCSNRLASVCRTSERSTVRSMHVALPAHRNPLFYPAILFALRHGTLPAFFHAAHAHPPARLAAALEDLRQECAWLGYSHLVTLCQRSAM